MVALFFIVFLPVFGAVTASAKSTSPSMIVHDQRIAPAAGFASLGAATDQHVLDMRVRLAQSDPEGLRSALMAVSTPGNPKYGLHLSKDEVASFTRPSSESTRAVQAFFASNGLNATAMSSAGDWLRVRIPAPTANALFAADYRVYAHNVSGAELVRTLQYSLPAELKPHIRMIHPSTSFLSSRSLPIRTSSSNVISPPRNTKQRPEDSNRAYKMLNRASHLSDSLRASVAERDRRYVDCSQSISPACLQWLYGIPTAPATQPSNRLLVTGYIGSYAQKSDLRSFLEYFRPDIDPATTFEERVLDGGLNPQGDLLAGEEANLDVQYTIGIATGVPTTFLSVGEDGAHDSFLATITALIEADSPPQVMTTSYNSPEQDVSPQLADALCNAYMQLGARGVSVVFSTGDSGVGDIQHRQCSDKFAPSFPSGCPYITTVGSTRGIAPETAAGFSSGGFSEIFNTPDYQAAAVAQYLEQLGDKYSGKFNPAGRGFPDVSTQGVNFAVINGSQPVSMYGTSASTPLFASMIALLNDELAAAGKPPLGFLNPWLYTAAASAFMDVTSGNNPGCGTPGFDALPGWDPVTGLGTPYYPALRRAAGLV